jgi:hypothetical protein
MAKRNYPLPINWSNPLSQGLRIAIPMSEGSGAPFDYARNTKSSFGGSTTWTKQLPGLGLSFSSSYVLVNSGKILAGQVNSSVFAIIKSSGVGSNGTPIYCERASSGNDIYKLQLRNDGGGTVGSLYFTYRDDAGTLTQIAASTALTDDKVHVVGVTKRGTAIVLYVDGIQVQTGTLTGNDTMTNTIEARIGADAGDAATFFVGSMYHLLGWNRVILPNEAKELYVNSWQIYQQPKFPLLNTIAAALTSASQRMMMGMGQ